MKKIVMVWGKEYEVTLHQKSKTVWVASGEYQGEHKSVQDRSPTSAATRWQEWARYKGNG